MVSPLETRGRHMSIISESETHIPITIGDREVANLRIMEQLLTDLLLELQMLHRNSKNTASKKNLLQFIERIREALGRPSS
jgi:hypothetical protein